MTIENKILRDLVAGQSTADSTAGRVGIACEAAEVIMERLVAEQKLLALEALGLRIYRLTDATRQTITAS
jgi:hypothetical protein